MKFLSLLMAAALLTSCFKTAEEIKREQQIDTQINQSSQIIAELTLQVKELQNRLASTTGQIEEIDHQTKTKTAETTMTFTQTMAQIAEQVKVLIDENQANKLKIAALEKEIETQKSYIKNVNSTLGKIAGPSKSSSKKKIDIAHQAFSKNKQKEALSLYLELLSEAKLNAAQMNHVHYNVGLLYYWKKNYDDSLVYLSKIYTQYPKSSWAPRSLLYIARSFKGQKKMAEANASYAELIQKYPNSAQAKDAKKEIEK